MFYKNSYFIVSYVVIFKNFSGVLLASRVDLLSRLTPKKYDLNCFCESVFMSSFNCFRYRRVRQWNAQLQC